MEKRFYRSILVVVPVSPAMNHHHASTRSLAIRTSFETGHVLINGDLCNVKTVAISRGVENAHRHWGNFSLHIRFDINRKESTTCSRVYKIRNQDLGRFDLKIRKWHTPKSSNLQILNRRLSVQKMSCPARFRTRPFDAKTAAIAIHSLQTLLFDCCCALNAVQ